MVIRPAELGMAAARIGSVSKAPFLIGLRPSLTLCSVAVRRRRSSGPTVMDTPLDTPSSSSSSSSSSSHPPPHSINGASFGGPKWKILCSEELGITTSMISKPTRLVLKGLQKKGHEVYLVGGCVRDLIMKRIPKDFDVLTTARLYEIQRAFNNSRIVGKRFPICHVHVDDTIVEVSSFQTKVKTKNSNNGMYKSMPKCSEKDFLRWRNCLCRDFTINGLMFDPFSDRIYDYLGGIDDIKKSKLQTVIPPDTSFQEDCARILRAIRIAARLGFNFSKETAVSVKDLAGSILNLDRGRILMELNYMLAYGSAEASLRLLWKFGVLDLLLPFQAAYFVSRGFKRRDKGTNMLLALFSNLDVLLAPDKPCNCCLWIALLAFHEALAKKPRDPLIIAVFALALHNGGNIKEAIKIANKITHAHDRTFPELSRTPRGKTEKDLEMKVVDLAHSVKHALWRMTNSSSVSKALAKYPRAPFSDLVFVSEQVQMKVENMLECVVSKDKTFNRPKKGSKINYSELSRGYIVEIRYVFARVVFDTVFPLDLENKNSDSVSQD